jgi:predicted RNA methylase
MGSDLQFHAFCLTDTGSRLDLYARAMSRVIQPDDVVVDLGAGTGILSFLACQAGARRVYAIEASDVAAYGEMLAAAGGFSDRVRFIPSPSTQVTLPERVDVIVADIHDTFGLQPGGLGALLDARDRFLKPGGATIPWSIRLLMAPVEAPEMYKKIVDVWRQQVHGIDLTPLRILAVNQQHPARFQPQQLIAPPVDIASIDLATAESLSVMGAARMGVSRAATLHGLCGCFMTTLAEGVVMGNVPGDSQTTNFAHAFFPIEAPHALGGADEVTIRMETYDSSELRWRIGITSADQIRRVHFDHATFLSRPIRADRNKGTSAYRPVLTVRGTMEQALLAKFDGGSSTEELERWLFERFAEQLPSPSEAAAFLKATIERCG